MEDSCPGEDVVQRLWTWTAALGNGAPLRADDGRPVRVLYPGYRNHEPGPDFVQAILALGDGPHAPAVRGAVEVHRRPLDWVTHGHHLDPRYTSVLLHVVFAEDGSGPTQAADGHPIPRVALAGAIPPAWRGAGAVPLWSAAPEPFPCRRTALDAVAAALDRAGDARFAAATARWRRWLGPTSETLWPDVDQLLWEGIAEALGYSKNSKAMRALAARVPLADLCVSLAAYPAPQHPEVAAACLLGTAGLLPAQHDPGGRRGPAAAVGGRPSARSRARRTTFEAPRGGVQALDLEPSTWNRLDGRWRSLPAPLVGSPLRGHVWYLGGARPENSPVRRVVALAYLACRWPRPSMARAVLAALATPGEARRRAAALCALLRGQATQGDQPLGAGRAADVVVNVLLPSAVALAERDGDVALAGAAWEVYRGHPPLTENWITRLVGERVLVQLGGGRRVPAGVGPRDGASAEASRRGLQARATSERLAGPATARRQQGLLHVYETVCGDLRCLLCPLAPRARGAVDGDQREPAERPARQAHHSAEQPPSGQPVSG